MIIYEGRYKERSHTSTHLYSPDISEQLTEKFVNTHSKTHADMPNVDNLVVDIYANCQRCVLFDIE